MEGHRHRPGISSWFVTCQVDEEVGGSVTMDFGGFGKETAVVTAWEPLGAWLAERFPAPAPAPAGA